MKIFSVSLLIILNIFILSVGDAAENYSSSISKVQKKSSIIWLVEDKKENLDLLNKNTPSTSVASYIESRIIALLTQYDIEIKRVSMKRIDHFLLNNNNVCVANRAKISSREKYSYFSSPQAFYLTHKLFRYDQRNVLPTSLFNEEGEIKSLKSVFTALPTGKIAIAEGVSFGKYLDKEIAQLNTDNIHYRGGANRVVALEAMLYAKHAEFLLALPIDMKPSKIQKPLLEQYTIQGAPPYLIAYISCSKSDIGIQVITDINQLLVKMYQSEDYYLAHKKWFGEKEIVKLAQYLHDNFSNEQFLKSK